MRHHNALFLLPILYLGWNPAASVVRAEPTAATVDFRRDIQPLFETHCLECHGDRKRRGGLLLTGRAAALLPSDSGKPAIMPGDSHKSELLRRVLSTSKDEQMPPRGPRLSALQITLLKTWIDQGAVWPTTAEAKHWAYQKPIRPNLPVVKNAHWPHNPIDHFILHRLEQEGLQPAPPVDRARLLRRVSLDLIGLPPTPAQVDAFVQDARPDAYERVVEALLASPHYGERWASHWLDLARYADSNGFQRDGFRDIWPYRDWVVKAFNADMPFEQFTIEQIAGDLLPNATLTQKIATGFNRCTTVNVEAGVDREEDRVHAIFDRVNTTASVWLGTTMICAQCHNHKYDPFSQKDYYQLFACFNNTAQETAEGKAADREFIGPQLNLPLPPREQQRRQTLLTQKQQLLQRLDELVSALRPDLASWEQECLASKAKLKALPKEIRTILLLPPKKRKQAQTDKVAEYFTGQQPGIKQMREQMTEMDRRLQQLQPPSTLVMQELEQPRETHVFKRGNFLEPLQKVQPGVPAALHPLPPGAPPNRLGLARWLVAADNPLTARVTVNRWWAEFFGHGLVETLEDFGRQSAAPTHPELLDWLATELVQSGWSMKKLHRRIVTSATYQQSAQLTPELQQRDPHNKLYARGPRLRLRAELIRDNALASSGLLSPKLGGPPVFPPQPEGLWNVTGRVDNTYRTSTGPERYRRGLYTIRRRSSPYPSFTAFDAPDRSACVIQRPCTNTPLQALTLMNDPVYIEAAIALAQRMLSEAPAQTAPARLAYGFRLCLARAPSPQELDVLAKIYHRAQQRYEGDPAAAHAVLQNSVRHYPEDPVQLAAWFQVATVLLNLDETITKN